MATAKLSATQFRILTPGTIQELELLDNPIWSALTTHHAEFSIGGELAKRFPDTIGPFGAIPVDKPENLQALTELFSPGELMVIFGPRPNSPEWEITKAFDLKQFILPQVEPLFDHEAVPLDDSHLPKILELIALVYPAYFRRDTPKLGQYYGIFDGDRLAAMAGTRFSFPGFREVSAICTHADYRNQGLASRITRHLCTHIRAEGETPFLHTEADNKNAQAVYAKLGFQLRETLDLAILRRV